MDLLFWPGVTGSRLELRSDPWNVEIDGSVDAGNPLGRLVVAWNWPERGHALQVHQGAAAFKKGNSGPANASVRAWKMFSNEILVSNSGLVVSVLAFDSDDPRSNLADFYSVKLFEKNKKNLKSAIGLAYLKTCNLRMENCYHRLRRHRRACRC